MNEPAGKDIRLIAIDLDGTLLTTDKRVTPRAVRAIRQSTRRGIHVVLASARPPRSVLAVHKQLGLRTCTINYNGALVYDPQTRKVIFHKPISAALAEQIITLARRHCPTILVSSEVLDKWYTDRVDPAYRTETAKLFKPDKIAPIEDWLNTDHTKILLQGPQDVCGPLLELLNEKFAREIHCLQTEDNLIQIMAAGASKSVALRAVCRHYRVDLASVMAVGDAPNDVGMLKIAGVGVAMANSPELIREAADFLTPANDEDGVAHAIEWFVLNKRR